MQSVAVFCGANKGHGNLYVEQATLLGKALAVRNIKVLFGGGSVGLMGALADAVLEAGGPLTGIITIQLNDLEMGHPGVKDMIVVESMAERRVLLITGTDGVIAMPGGYGTMDELFEALTLAQLHQYRKPIGLLNTDGYYNPLLNMLDEMVEKGFLRAQNRQLLVEAPDVETLIFKMKQYEYNPIGKWA